MTRGMTPASQDSCNSAAKNSPISSGKQLADLDTPSLEPTSQDAWDRQKQPALSSPTPLPAPPHPTPPLSRSLYIYKYRA